MTADQVKEARLRLGLTQLELARVMGIKTPIRISRWETGHSKISDEAVTLLAMLLRESGVSHGG